MNNQPASKLRKHEKRPERSFHETMRNGMIVKIKAAGVMVTLQGYPKYIMIKEDVYENDNSSEPSLCDLGGKVERKDKVNGRDIGRLRTDGSLISDRNSLDTALNEFLEETSTTDAALDGCDLRAFLTAPEYADSYQLESQYDPEFGYELFIVRVTLPLYNSILGECKKLHTLHQVTAQELINSFRPGGPKIHPRLKPFIEFLTTAY